MKTLFLAISDRLKTQIEALKWIDLDTGQLEHYEGRPAVLFPCALIDIEYPNCEDLDSLSQKVDATITLRLAFEPKGETNTAAPDLTRTRALTILDTVEAIHDALQGYTENEFSELSRANLKIEKREDPLKVYNLIYTTTLQEG
jgi:hypothetical protein